MLLSHGAQIDARNNNNQTALMLAVQNGSKTFDFCLNVQTFFQKILSNCALQAMMMLLMSCLEMKPI